ncbi:MAG TPA: N-acetylmuramoyl-L-alanine amidase [Anaeromyxobacter sp.]|nr:N-acetylmuramoyl-L-alanine amidase [Anaeromyxobacter sp.]
MTAAAAALALALAAPPAFTVVLDPGHGGERDGALSPTGAKEKDLVLAISRRIAQRIRKVGGKVVFTRTGDIYVPLPNRAAIATAIRADLFLSVHLNSMPTPEQRRHTHGVETYFLSPDASDTHASAVAARENADRLAGEPEPDPDDPVAGILSDLQDAEALQSSSRLAYDIHERLVERLGAEDRGVKQAPFYVLAGARMPAVLLEVGFISHDEEGRKLRTREYQERVAEAVVEGIRAFRTETRRASR